MNVMVIGASSNPARYSNMAIRMLADYGHTPVLVSPREQEIHGFPCITAPSQYVGEPIDTVTLYVGAPISTKLSAEIRALKPRRVIMNPGAENEVLASELETDGVEVVEGCTLVMLRSGQF